MKQITKIIHYIVIIVLLSILSVSAYSQEPPHQYDEIIFINSSSNYLFEARCFPVSAIYNHEGELNLRSNYTCTEPNNLVYFNNATMRDPNSLYSLITVTPGHNKNLNYEGVYNGGEMISGEGNIGTGIYKILFRVIDSYNPPNVIMEDEVCFEIDANGASDLHFVLYDNWNNNGMSIVYYVDDIVHIGPEKLIGSGGANYYIRMWSPYQDLGIEGWPNVDKNFGNCTYGNGNLDPYKPVPNPYNELPQVCISDCILNGVSYNQTNTGELFSREGRIPLNTTFKKNITTRINYPQYSSANVDVNLSAEPGVKLTIGSGLNYSTSGDISLKLIPFGSTLIGNILTIKDPMLSQNPTTTLKLEDLEGSQSYTRNAKLIVESYCKTIIENNAKLYCGKYSQIYLQPHDNSYTTGGLMKWQANSIVDMQDYSQIFVGNYSNLFNFGTIFSNSIGAEIKVESNGLFELMDNVTQTISNGGKVTIDGNGKLKIGANSKLVFDGANSNFVINANSTIELGANAKIEFKNGSNLIANGCIISSSNSSNPGIGFILENAGAITSITNCTFNSLTNPIYINSTTASASGEAKYIYNNTFNMDNSCNYVIETKYVNNITVSNNHINMQVGKGIGILMRYPTNLGDGESAAVPYIVNVLGNTISNGSFSAAFICGTSAYAGINFRYNNCNGSPTYCNIHERQVTSDFKYNTITSSTSTNFEMYQSNQNVFSNTFNTSHINIYNNNSYPLLAPVSNNSSDGGWIWHGGQNKIYSTGNGNINYDHGTVALDWGQNCFLKNMNYNHLWGQIDEPSLSYKLRNNDFNNSNIPITGLFDVTSGLQVVPFSNGSDFGCNNTTNMGVIWQIRDLGNGLFDTLFKTSNNSGYQPPQDESIYSSALLKKSTDENFDAISYFKALITGFPTSSHTDACLYSLYECYQKLDTSNNQGIRDLLYTDLKNYLDGKILSGLYSDEFNFTAYNITMMCLTSIADYNDAITGYEFISLYHPDAYLRLLASWDYVEVQALLNGSGGISSKEENLTDKASLEKRLKRVNKSVNEDPIKSKVKKSYDKIKAENTSKIKKTLTEKNNDEKIVKSELKKNQHSDEMMSLKVNSVMRNSGHLTTEARDKNQIEDLLFSKNVNSNNISKINTVLPSRYDISQNYPNPFNPSTTIKYTLPNNGLVSIKIFDITGREVKTLVNEIKTAGNYEVEFNGSEFATGVYFYRMQSGNFVQTKRMVLIK